MATQMEFDVADAVIILCDWPHRTMLSDSVGNTGKANDILVRILRDWESGLSMFNYAVIHVSKHRWLRRKLGLPYFTNGSTGVIKHVEEVIQMLDDVKVVWACLVDDDLRDDVMRLVLADAIVEGGVQ